MPESNKKEAFTSFLTYGSLGLEMGLSVAIGIGIGYYLDRFFKTSPILTLIFLMFGVAAGMKRLYQVWKKVEKESEDQGRDTR